MVVLGLVLAVVVAGLVGLAWMTGLHVHYPAEPRKTLDKHVGW
jgi:hypothetical protein